MLSVLACGRCGRSFSELFLVAFYRESIEFHVRVGNPRVLFENPAWTWQSGPNYDVTPDGKRIIGVELREEILSSPLHVVLNWKAELADRLAAQKG